MNSFSPITSEAVLCAALISSACSFGGGGRDEVEDILHGSISYPFVRSNPMGVNGKPDKFIIRSITGGTEYVIEIPDAGEDYDIEIPMAGLKDSGLPGTTVPKGLSPPSSTDSEITASLPDMTKEAPRKSALMDKAFGVGKGGGPGQSPSYTLGIAKITRFYKQKQFEYALIEVNHLLSYFPQSPRLHKMKGTIYIRLHNFELAEKSWSRALEYNPGDRLLKAGLDRLRRRIQRTTTPRSEWPATEPPTAATQPQTQTQPLTLESASGAAENTAEENQDSGLPESAESVINNAAPSDE